MNEKDISTQRKFGLSRSDLKIITMALMVLDHSYNMLFPDLDILKIVGRISFPIFCYLTVEGFRHTSNVKKYMLRLFIFGIISEIPFNLLVGWDLRYGSAQNVMWTLLIGVMVLYGFEKCKRFNNLVMTFLVTLIAALGLGLADFLRTDYGGFGVLQIIVFYIFYDKVEYSKLGQLIGIGVINGHLLSGRRMNLGFIGMPDIAFSRQIFGVLSLPIIWLYNGEKGIDSKVFNYICYWFYPAHIMILAFIKYIIFS